MFGWHYVLSKDLTEDIESQKAAKQKGFTYASHGIYKDRQGNAFRWSGNGFVKTDKDKKSAEGIVTTHEGGEDVERKDAEERISKTFSDYAAAHPPTKQNYAENAIRDLFLRKRNQGKLSQNIMHSVLKHKTWHKLYGKKELETAFEGLVKDGYINKKGNDYVWGIE